jgi:hypothetical protein
MGQELFSTSRTATTSAFSRTTTTSKTRKDFILILLFRGAKICQQSMMETTLEALNIDITIIMETTEALAPMVVEVEVVTKADEEATTQNEEEAEDLEAGSTTTSKDLVEAVDGETLVTTKESKSNLAVVVVAIHEVAIKAVDKVSSLRAATQPLTPPSQAVVPTRSTMVVGSTTTSLRSTSSRVVSTELELYLKCIL